MKFIRLTEITKNGGAAKFEPTIVNTAFIVGVSTGELREDDGAFIIGESKVKSVRLMQLSVGRPVFVQETMEEIAALISQEGLAVHSLN